jgi:hypothetical protein
MTWLSKFGKFAKKNAGSIAGMAIGGPAGAIVGGLAQRALFGGGRGAAPASASPTNSDRFAQALNDYSRPAGTPQAVTDLAKFDPQASLNTYATGAWDSILNQAGGMKDQLRDLAGSSVGAGRVDSGLFDEDRGEVMNRGMESFGSALAQQGMNAASLRASTLNSAAGFQEEEQNRYLELVRAGMDDDTARQNARAAARAGTWGAIGQIAGTVGTAIASSSKRYKDDIEPIDSASERLERIPGVRFRYKGSDRPEVGVIAEDVDEVLPEAVVRDEQGRPDEVDYAKVIPLVLEATREQGQAIREIQSQIEQLAGGGMLGSPGEEEMPVPRRMPPRRMPTPSEEEDFAGALASTAGRA